MKTKMLKLFTALTVMLTITACSTPSQSNQEPSEVEKFPEFSATNFNGETVDNSIFSQYSMTLLNFWSNGCVACIDEMPDLEQFNKELSDKEAQIIGVNVDAASSQEALDEAKTILNKHNVTYQNIYIDKTSPATEYIEKIFAYPTTIIVDKNGNIIGEPITGNINSKAWKESILSILNEINAGEEVNTESLTQPTMDPQLTALIEQEGKIIESNNELWDKVFKNCVKLTMDEMEALTYPQLLQHQVESCTDLFTQEELDSLMEDIRQITEIESKIDQLESIN